VQAKLVNKLFDARESLNALSSEVVLVEQHDELFVIFNSLDLSVAISELKELYCFNYGVQVHLLVEDCLLVGV
jgi:hypothetical protein